MSEKQLKVLELNDTVKENLKKMYMILAGLQIVKLVLWFMETFVSKCSIEQMNYEYKKTHSFYSVYSGTFLNAIVIIISVLSILICVFAVHKMCVEKKLFTKVLKPVMIVSCIHYAFYLCLSISEAASNNSNFTQAYGQGMAEVYSGPNFLGIIQLVAIIASTIITFKISSQTKAIEKYKKEQINVETI